METRILQFDGETVTAEMVETVTVSKSKVVAELNELKVKKEELEKRQASVFESLAEVDEQLKDKLKQYELVELAEAKQAAENISESEQFGG